MSGPLTPYGIILDHSVGRVHKRLHFTLCRFSFCLTVISLKASEDSSFEKKKETWAFFEGRPCMFLYYKMPLVFRE